MQRKNEHIPPDLLDIATALEEHRPQLTDLELDRIKRRAMVRGARTTPTTTRPKGSFMRSRLAIMATLVTGMLMSTGGAALGVTALTSTDSASEAQYGAPAVTPTVSPATAPPATAPPAQVLGAQGSEESTDDTGSEIAGAEAPGVAGERASTPETAAAQAPRQLAADSDDELPFTGYASIPLLLIGLALLATGLVLRRSTNRAPTA